MTERSLIGHWGNRDSDDFLYQIAFDFVAHLSNIMESEGIGRAELAQKLGVSKGRVSQILNNPGNLTLKLVVEYARAIGYKVAIVTYDDGGNDNNGPVNPQIFTSCWEKLGRPTDFFQAGMAVASTGDPVDESYARNVRLERLENALAAVLQPETARTRKEQMLTVRELKPQGAQTNAGTDAA
jgi:transcriptional regulator with XRE-family HTH domain